MRRRLPSFCLRNFGASSGLQAGMPSMESANSLELRPLGDSSLHITRIGFGAWAVGGSDWEFAWGTQEDRDSIAAIRRALELGINWIDTAAVYGLGHSEEVVAEAVQGVRQKPFLFTKCARRWDPQTRRIYRSLKRESVREECEASLRRLKVDVIDLYQMHWPQPDEDVEEGWETMAKLKEEGKVRFLGVSNFSVAQMERAMKIAPITALQPPYSLVNPKVETEILPFCKEHNIGVIHYAPMASGLLTGKMSAERVRMLPDNDWRKTNPNFIGEKLERNLALAEMLGGIAKQRGVEPGVVAIAWTLHNPAVTAAIVGSRSAEQVEGTMPATSFRLSEEEFRQIEAFRAQSGA